MEEEQVSVIREGRSLAETPTWSVATVTSVLVFVCFVVERSIFRFGRWLKKTRRKALFASLEKIKEELMLLGLISLMLGQWASWISEICVDSSLFNSKFFLCSEQDFDATPTSGKYYLTLSHSSLLNTSFRFESESSAGSSTRNVIPPQGLSSSSQHSYHHQCGMDREPFVSSEGLEQLHRFLFVLGITHVLYSCFAVGLAMTKIYSWRKWESQAASALPPDPQARRNKVMRRQSTFAFHHASHPWSRNRFLIWMLCFLRQFKSSIRKSDYLALRLGFITNHNLPLSYNFHKYMVRSMEDEFHAIVGISWPLWAYAIICILLNIHGNLFLFEMFLLLLPVSSYEVHVLLDTESIFSVAGLNIYFWLSFIPAILVMVVGTKLEHVVSILALEIAEPTGASVRTQVKPRDELFWFGKPEILLRLIQFISFQSAFEMATFLWALWGFKQRSCFMKNHAMVIVRLASGVLVQFWCSYSTVPLSVIITQMGSKCRKALVAESVRESLHSWCKRVKEKSRRSQATRSVCSLDTGTVDERDEITTVASLTLSSCSSDASLNEVAVAEDVNNTAQRNNITTVASRALDQEEDTMAAAGGGCGYEHELSFRLSEYISQSAENTFVQPGDSDEELRIEEESGRRGGNVGPRLYELFQRSDDSDKYI